MLQAARFVLLHHPLRRRRPHPTASNMELEAATSGTLTIIDFCEPQDVIVQTEGEAQRPQRQPAEQICSYRSPPRPFVGDRDG